MHATELVTLACAHGIDWLRVAGGETNLKGPAGKRRKAWVDIEPGVTERSRKKQLIEAPDTAKGKGSRVAKAQAYSQAELGIAAYGVTALHWAAAQHSIANDRLPNTIRTLMCGLRYYANKMATAELWETVLPARFERDPKTGRRIVKRDPVTKVKLVAPRDTVFYFDPLCMLVLDEISFRPAFAAAPTLYAVYMGVEEQTWDKVLTPRFQLLQQQYARWYASGLALIQRRIMGDPDQEPQRPAA